MYVVVITCFMFILMIVLLITLYEDTGASHSLVNDPLFWQTMMCVVLCFLLMGINLTYLYLINTQMKLQRGILSLIILGKYRYINQLEMYFQKDIQESNYNIPIPSSQYNNNHIHNNHNNQNNNQNNQNNNQNNNNNGAYVNFQELLLQQSEIISSFENILNLLDKVDEIKGSKLAGFKIERQHIVWVITTLLLFIYSMIQFMNKQSHSDGSIW